MTSYRKLAQDPNTFLDTFYPNYVVPGWAIVALALAILCARIQDSNWIICLCIHIVFNFLKIAKSISKAFQIDKKIHKNLYTFHSSGSDCPELILLYPISLIPCLQASTYVSGNV